MALSDFEKALGVILGLLLFGTLTNILGITINIDIYNWAVLFSCMTYILWVKYPWEESK